ncbi:ArsR family transcriptional regulator [Streptomyces sp. NPDC048392]|uniref:ArsR family transcriptional regulator n=1 Tax=Streptomyces sp. NPDC048392 TaxID=3365543 RepID=UPI00371427A9
MPRTPVRGTRLDILEWLKDPAAHFPPRPRADVVEHGVHADAVAAKLGVARRVAETHLAHLAHLAGLGRLRTGRVRRRTHCRRDEVRIAEVPSMFETGLQTRTSAPADDACGTVPE